jgi:predicted small integral membrane protein
MWLYIILLILTYIFNLWFFVGTTNMRYPKHEQALKNARGLLIFSLIVLVIIGFIAFNFVERQYFYYWFSGIILFNLFAEMRNVKKIKREQSYLED